VPPAGSGVLRPGNHGRPAPVSGEPIVHHHHAALKRLTRPAAPVANRTALQLTAFSRVDRSQLVRGDLTPPYDLLVNDAHPVFTDRSHAQLRLERHPQLAHYDHTQRRPQGPGDLEGHWDATSRQANNHDTLTAQMPQSRGQAPSRIGTIFEIHGYPSQRRTTGNLQPLPRPIATPGPMVTSGRLSAATQGEADGRRKGRRALNTRLSLGAYGPALRGREPARPGSGRQELSRRAGTFASGHQGRGG